MSEWTIETLLAHFTALRIADKEFYTERDRRYTEVSSEQEKALKIKESGDRTALELARDIQIYKDEKANQLREQITSERFTYVTKEDLRRVEEKFEVAFKPIGEYVTSQQGQKTGFASSGSLIMAVLGAAGIIFSMAMGLIGLLGK